MKAVSRVLTLGVVAGLLLVASTDVFGQTIARSAGAAVGGRVARGGMGFRHGRAFSGNFGNFGFFGGGAPVGGFGVGGLGFGGLGAPYFGYGYGFGLNALHATGQIPIPPYFSLHPPVYYGQNVRRSYGLSPFAALPGIESYQQPPRMVYNTHLPSATAANGKQPVMAAAHQPEPQLIINPFYHAEKAQLASAADDQ